MVDDEEECVASEDYEDRAGRLSRPFPFFLIFLQKIAYAQTDGQQSIIL